MKSISVRSSAREEMLDITRGVEGKLPDGDGVCVLFTQHTTCGLTVNENADPDVKSDMLGWMRRLVPQYPPRASGTTPAFGHPSLDKEGSSAATPPQGESFFKHFEHNSDAHIKSSLVGSSVTVPFENGKLCLGRWQGIYLCEFDGPRERTVVVKIMNAE